MGVYIGDYQDDFGNIYKFTPIYVGIIDEVTLLTSRGRFERTSFNFDREYLPQLFLDNVQLKQSRQAACNINDLLIKRFAKFYLSSTSYLKVELPFNSQHPLFDQFFISAFFNNISTILTIGIEGEFMYV